MFGRFSFWTRWIAAAAVCFLVAAACAGEVMPPTPLAYFNDYAGVTRPDTARRLDTLLKEFEREQSSQIVVAVFRKMQSDSSIEDFTVRIAQSWHVGRKGANNGAVLFVFVEDRKMYIQVGYGLEGALPDYRCHQIIEDSIKPRFRAGDFDGGLTAAVNAMLSAARGEYQGTGKTVAEEKNAGPRKYSFWENCLIYFLVIVFCIICVLIDKLISLFYKAVGWERHDSWFDSSGSGSGGGGFSGGGGSFGGGGAGGSW